MNDPNHPNAGLHDNNSVSLGGAASQAKDGFSRQLAKLTTVETSKMLTIMKVLNVINMLGVATLGILSFARLGFKVGELTGGNIVQRFFVAGYTTSFAILFMIFELRCSRFDAGLRQKCGFLFSFMGKTLFVFL